MVAPVGAGESQSDDAAHPRRVRDALQLKRGDCVPHAHVRSSTELSRGDPLAVGVDRHALDVVVVAEEKPLALFAFLEFLLIEDDAHRGGVVANLARAQIKNVRRGVVQTRVAVHVVQLELRVRRFAAPRDVPRVEFRGWKHCRATLGVDDLPVMVKIVIRLVPVSRVAIHQRFHPEKTRGGREERLNEHLVGHEPVAIVAVLDEKSGGGGL